MVDGDLSDKPKTARSYRAGVIDDNFSLHINIKWLVQLFVAIGSCIFVFVQVANRITELERRMELTNTSIEELVSKHIIEEEAKIAQMQQELDWYEKELNLNPLSWGKKKRKKK